MLKTIFQLIIISLLCFLGGYLISAWNGKRLNVGALPTLIQNDSLQIEKKIQATVEPLIKKYLKPAEKVVAKVEEHKAPPKKETTNKTPEERLDDLWLVKPATDELSGYKTGQVFIEGISPYGPPRQFKQDLFNPEDMPHVKADPDLITANTNQPRYMVPMSEVEVSGTHYWVQLADFDSFDKAHYAYLFLKRKGYDVGIYVNPMKEAMTWYALRLNTPHRMEHATYLSELILRNEKVKPTLVPFKGHMKKLA